MSAASSAGAYDSLFDGDDECTLGIDFDLDVQMVDAAPCAGAGHANKASSSAVSRGSAGWKERCTALWSTKANVCSAARALLEEETKTKSAQDVSSDAKCAAMEAYKLSVADAARRTEVSFEEMCFDASDDATNTAGAVWSFRFKESAGRDWTSWDPWWRGNKARKLVFLKDGTVRQVHPQGLESSAVTINGARLYDVFSERTVERDGRDVPAPRIEMSWRFVAKPLDLPARPEGAYVRITVGGRDVPTYVVRRSPTGNWGFVLESCWGESDGEGDEGADGEHEQERMRNVRRRVDLLVEESAMTQDGRSQWREALLYNIGAVTLPEGRDTQAEEFDRAWQNAMFLRR
ncbi:hypothetical protein ACHAXT_008803 [Thalassiosira profunda]